MQQYSSFYILFLIKQKLECYKLNTEYSVQTSSFRLMERERETMRERVETLQRENQKYLEENRMIQITKTINEQKIMELQHLLVCIEIYLE